jgi:hypothetical protein
MSFSIPEAVVSWSEKLAYCVAAQEKLRLDHNVHGKSFRDGEVTEAAWEQYKGEVFQPLSIEIGLMLNLIESATEDLPTVDLAWLTETELVLPEGLTWPEQLGLCKALSRQDLTDEQRGVIGLHSSMQSIPQEALDAISLFTQSLTNVKSFLILKDGSRHPVTMEVDSVQYSDGRVDKVLRVPTINTGVATN